MVFLCSTVLACLIFVGIIWATAAHSRLAFSNIKVVVYSPAYHHPFEDLVPLIVKSVGKEYGNFYTQNQSFLRISIQSHLFGAKSDVKLVRERVIWDEKSHKPGTLTLTKRLAYDHVQMKGNRSGIFNLEMNLNGIRQSIGQLMLPLIYVHPLSRTPLLDVDLFCNMLRLGSDMPSLPEKDADASQSNHDSDDRSYQVGAIERVFCGIVGVFFVCLCAWLSLYRATIARNIWGFYGILFLAFASLLFACVFCDISFFNGGNAWLRLWDSYAGS